jgi:hypothetical protein
MIILFVIVYYIWYYTKQPYVKAKTLSIFILQFIPFFWVFVGVIEKLKGMNKKFKALHRKNKQNKYNGGKNDKT